MCSSSLDNRVAVETFINAMQSNNSLEANISGEQLSNAPKLMHCNFSMGSGWSGGSWFGPHTLLSDDSMYIIHCSAMTVSTVCTVCTVCTVWSVGTVCTVCKALHCIMDIWVHSQKTLSLLSFRGEISSKPKVCLAYCSALPPRMSAK